MSKSNIAARLLAAVAFVGAAAGSASAQDAALVEAAKKEGTVTVYTSTDAEQAQKFLDAFKAKYGLKVEWNDLGTNGAYNRTISEAAANQVTADIVWSSAMDQQMTLVTDGYADTYKSAEAGNIPTWANYKDTLYASTVEPIGMIYNTKALPADRIPKTRADLVKFLNDNSARAEGQGCVVRSRRRAAPVSCITPTMPATRRISGISPRPWARMGSRPIPARAA